MKKQCLAVAAAALLSASFAAPAFAKKQPKFEKKWQRCKTTADCIVVEGACGDPQCINRRSTKKAAQYYESLKPYVDCNIVPPGQKASAVCEQKSCRCQSSSS